LFKGGKGGKADGRADQRRKNEAAGNEHEDFLWVSGWRSVPAAPSSAMLNPAPIGLPIGPFLTARS
jgi:hypothetical protein